MRVPNLSGGAVEGDCEVRETTSWGERDTVEDGRLEDEENGTGRDGSASVQVVEETDSYTSSVAGTTVEAVRAGRGVGPTRVLGVRSDRLTVTSSRIGFPMLTHSVIPDGRVVATFMNDVDGDSRFCGIPLQRSRVIVYGPGVEHVAASHPGLSFTFAITEADELQRVGEGLGVPIELPLAGDVHEFQKSSETLRFGAALHGYVEAAGGARALRPRGEHVLEAFASLLALPERGRSVGRGKGIDSREVVRDCIAHVESTDRIPTIGELCLAAHVSERRLRDAFTEEFDQPPSRYFRAWALDEAHRRLRRTTSERHTVAEVAADLGFDHLGRFAGHYRHMYGEPPSVTLAASRHVAS